MKKVIGFVIAGALAVNAGPVSAQRGTVAQPVTDAMRSWRPSAWKANRSQEPGDDHDDPGARS